MSDFLVNMVEVARIELASKQLSSEHL